MKRRVHVLSGVGLGTLTDHEVKVSVHVNEVLHGLGSAVLELLLFLWGGVRDEVFVELLEVV